MENVPNRKISKTEEEWAANVIRKYTTSDPSWPRGSVNTIKVDQKRSNDQNVPDEIDFKTTYAGSGHNKGFTTVYIIRIRKDDEGKIEFYHVRKGFGPDSEEIIHGIMAFIKQNIKESYIDPSSNTDELKYHVTKMEEEFALRWIKRKFLPAVIKDFNDNLVAYNNYYTRVGLSRTLMRISNPDEVIKNVQKVTTNVNKNTNGRSVVYFTKDKGGAEFLFRIEKSYPDVVAVAYLDPFKKGYMQYELKPGGYPGDKFSFGKLEENTNKPNRYISKEEEHKAYAYIVKYRTGKPEGTKPPLIKVQHERSKFPTISDIIVYKSTKDPSSPIFFTIRKNEKGGLEYQERSNTGGLLSQFPIRENINPNRPNLSISKGEENHAFQTLSNMGIHKPSGYIERLGKTLKKVKHYKSPIPQISDTIEYKDSDNPSFTYVVKKDDSGVLHLTYRVQDAGSTYEEMGGRHYIFENIQPNLSISKEEEEKAFRFLSRRKDCCGDPITMRKVAHQRSNDPKISDRIEYLSPANTDIVYFVVKDEGGNLIYGLRIPEDNYTSLVTAPIPLNENHPSGNWSGWEDITQPEKDRLKLALQQYQEYLKRIYHPNLLAQKTYIIQKCIDNLDVSDPRYAAKPLSKLPMEMRMSIMDFIDHVDTTGQSSKVIGFLMNISRQYIESPKPPKSDIELKDVTNIVWPGGRRRGNVEIHGLDDMNPVINFGYGPYTLDDRFMSEYSKPGSQLYLDFGQKVKVVNISDVMIKVKDAIKRYKRYLTEDVENRSVVLSKEDEERSVLFLRNMTIDGERVGKTLRKVRVEKTDSPNVSDAVCYRSIINGKEYIFKIFRSLRRGLIVFDAINYVNYFPEKPEALSQTSYLKYVNMG